MDLAALLDIRPGITAVIGSGGKTMLLRTLRKNPWLKFWKCGSRFASGPRSRARESSRFQTFP